MRKSQSMQELERAYGKPIERLIIDAYNERGSVRAAAEELGVNPNTLYSWMRFLHIAIGGKQAIPYERDPVSA